MFGFGLTALFLVGIAVWILQQISGVAPAAAPGDPGAIPVNVAPMSLQIVQLAQAIANAEGFGIPGAVPTRAHNPGDLALGDKGLGVANSAGVTIFASDAAGWSALYYELNLIFSGRSSVYSAGMSFAQFAQTWTGGDNPGGWLASVASAVGASPDTALSDWFNA